VTQAIAIVGFVLVPMLVTMVVPRTTIVLRPVDDNVHAEVTRYALLCIPYRYEVLAPVTSATAKVRDAVHKNRLDAEDRRKGRAQYQAGDGVIILENPGGESWIQSTPADAVPAVERIQAYLQSPAPEPLVIHASAGWLFTYVLGGTMTGLAALYVTGATLAMLQWLITLVRRAGSFPSSSAP
jgi:hypothetical protein